MNLEGFMTCRLRPTGPPPGIFSIAYIEDRVRANRVGIISACYEAAISDKMLISALINCYKLPL